MEEAPQNSFGSKLASLGRAALQETQRGAHLAALKAKMEKARHVDLSSAYRMLGERAYQLKVSADRLSQHYVEIEAVEADIQTKRQGITSLEGASTTERVKNAAVSGKMKLEAEMLERQVNGRFTALGEEIQTWDVPELKQEHDAVAAVQFHIADLEKEYATCAADKSAQRVLKDASMGVMAKLGGKIGPVLKAHASSFPVSKVLLVVRVTILTVILFGSLLLLLSVRRQKTGGPNPLEPVKNWWSERRLAHESQDAAATQARETATGDARQQKLQQIESSQEYKVWQAGLRVEAAETMFKNAFAAMSDDSDAENMSGVTNLKTKRSAADGVVFAQRSIQDAFAIYKSVGGTARSPEDVQAGPDPTAQYR